MTRENDQVKDQVAANSRSARRTRVSKVVPKEPLSALPRENTAGEAPSTGSQKSDLHNIAAKAAHRDAQLRKVAQTLSANITNPQHYFQLAQGLFQQEQYRRATRLYQRALEVDPTHVPSCLAIARCMNRLGEDMDKVEAYLRQASEVDPQNVEMYLLWAEILSERQRLPGAEAKLRKALEIEPGNPIVLYHLARIVRTNGALEPALRMMEKALAGDPTDRSSRFGRGLLALQQGEWSFGWREYDLRCRSLAMQNPLLNKRPVWDGSALKGKSILVTCGPSLVDNLMFASCLHDVAAQSQRCVVEVDRRLLSIFQRSFESIECVPTGSLAEYKQFDCWSPLASLPRFLRTASSRFPENQQPFAANDSWTALHRRNLNDLGPGLKVGISWDGLFKSDAMDGRSTQLAHWKPILDVQGVHLVSLQGPESYAEMQQALELHPGAELVHWDFVQPQGDIDDLASLVAAFDLVISVPNRVAHLAGALGVPTWTVLSDWPSWRWGLVGAKTPWYPEMTLYRATRPNCWSVPMTAMAKELREIAHKKSNWTR